MKEFLSDRVNNMALSATLAMAAKARELKAQGKDIISLSLGEPDFAVPDFVKLLSRITTSIRPWMATWN